MSLYIHCNQSIRGFQDLPAAILVTYSDEPTEERSSEYMVYRKIRKDNHYTNIPPAYTVANADVRTRSFWVKPPHDSVPGYWQSVSARKKIMGSFAGRELVWSEESEPKAMITCQKRKRNRWVDAHSRSVVWGTGHNVQNPGFETYLLQIYSDNGTSIKDLYLPGRLTQPTFIGLNGEINLLSQEDYPYVNISATRGKDSIPIHDADLNLGTSFEVPFGEKFEVPNYELDTITVHARFGQKHSIRKVSSRCTARVWVEQGDGNAYFEVRKLLDDETLQMLLQ